VEYTFLVLSIVNSLSFAFFSILSQALNLKDQCAGVFAIVAIAIVILMMIGVLPLSMCRHSCYCEEGVVALVTMVVLPLICKQHCCPHHNGVVAILKLALLPSLQWGSCHHECAGLLAIIMMPLLSLSQ
jgi:hypothetical protein